jgi:hypothetical protein
VASGALDCVLVLGFEQMRPGALASVFTDRPAPFDDFDAVTDRLVGRPELPLALRYFGGAGLAHMEKYGTPLDAFARIRAKASRHAAGNPLALLRKELSVQDVLDAPAVWPGVMTRLMACPPTCGAAAAVLVSEDFGGGAMMLAFGVVCALLEAKGSGRGQVVDAAMTDGAALLGAMMYGLRAAGGWSDAREANLLDGGAPFYDTYACADGRFISIGAIEPWFYVQLLELTGTRDPDFKGQWRRQDWPRMKRKFVAMFAMRPRDAWCALLEGTDACFAPVLDMDEASRHPHNAARKTFMESAGVVQPAPAPRFSRTVPATPAPPPRPGQHGAEILADWGWSPQAIAALRSDNLV